VGSINEWESSIAPELQRSDISKAFHVIVPQLVALDVHDALIRGRGTDNHHPDMD
jgi:hypothetical protein